jgi:DNA-binding GntR family transcriptional regulator
LAGTRKIERVMLPNQVLEVLRERIVDRVYAPEDRLNIDALALELQVSSTPIREALGRLVAEGLVRSEPFVGFSVAPMPREQWYRELYEFRLLLEPWAAAAAATRRDPAVLAELESLLAAMDEASLARRYRRFRSFTDADAAFHHSIIAGAGNAPALKSYDDLRIHLHLSRLFIDRDQHTADTRRQHQGIYRAILAGDADKAAARMREHLNESKDLLIGKPAAPPARRQASSGKSAKEALRT